VWLAAAWLPLAAGWLCAAVHVLGGCSCCVDRVAYAVACASVLQLVAAVSGCRVAVLAVWLLPRVF